MLDRIEKFMDKLLPDLRKGQKAREKTTEEVVNKSEEKRRESVNGVFDAYRKAGIVVSGGLSGHRRWED
jgi:hypothetical protein